MNPVLNMIWLMKVLRRRTASNKLLRDKACSIATNLKYDGYQSGTVSLVYKCFDERSLDSTVTRDQLDTLVTRDKSAIKS